MGTPPYPGSPVSPVKKYLALSTALLTLAVTGLLLFGGPADARAAQFQARLRDADGRVIGTVRFEVDDHAMHVDATLRRNPYVTPDAFHGFHLHANADPANGQGCQADPDAPPTTWFGSADGHFSETVQDHGQHAGDLPSPLVMADGTARLAFSTDRIDPADLRGLAVILHDDPDNFGNVPVGDEPTDYIEREEALALTARTGNAGDRMACGVVRRSFF